MRLGLEKAKPHNVPLRESPHLGVQGDKLDKKKKHEQLLEERRRAKEARKKAERASCKAAGKGKKDMGGGKGKKNKRLPPGVTLLSNSNCKPICFAYGTGGCKREECKMLHVCQICEGGHPWKQCSTMTE